MIIKTSTEVTRNTYVSLKNKEDSGNATHILNNIHRYRQIKYVTEIINFAIQDSRRKRVIEVEKSEEKLLIPYVISPHKKEENSTQQYTQYCDVTQNCTLPIPGHSLPFTCTNTEMPQDIVSR
jgi:hypothetical protein